MRGTYGVQDTWLMAPEKENPRAHMAMSALARLCTTPRRPASSALCPEPTRLSLSAAQPPCWEMTTNLTVLY